MRIAFFAPHKPIDHKVPSGDLIIGKSLHDFLCSKGHTLNIASRMRLRNITGTPAKWPSLCLEYYRTLKRAEKFKPDLWLTYHSYYKSPDLLGPAISSTLGIPYVIYQGVFATKHRRNIRTWAGYMANKKALIHADHIFANKDIDFHNLSRIIIPEKLTRTYPGIRPGRFSFCAESRKNIREKYSLENKTVILSTAMLRDDVKAESMTDLIKAFAHASRQIPNAQLLIAGDGEARSRLEKLASQLAGSKITFLGQVPRDDLYKFYSAADLFAFPGINEALGMVYLEAQAAGLPVVAYSTRGPSEAVAHQLTGLLSPEGDIEKLSANLARLLNDRELRKEMSRAATDRISRYFDLDCNMKEVESRLIQISRRRYS